MHGRNNIPSPVVLNLRRGCASADSATGELFLIGKPGKGYDRRPDTSTQSADPQQSVRPWTVVGPVHTAVDILQRLHPYDLLFPAAIVLERADRNNTHHARTINGITDDINHMMTWVNDTFTPPGGRPAIPPDPEKHIHASRLRRTLAYFIVRRPRGLIAAALQYGHVNTRVTLGYANPQKFRLMHDRLSGSRSDAAYRFRWRCCGPGR